MTTNKQNTPQEIYLRFWLFWRSHFRHRRKQICRVQIGQASAARRCTCYCCCIASTWSSSLGQRRWRWELWGPAASAQPLRAPPLKEKNKYLKQGRHSGSRKLTGYTYPRGPVYTIRILRQAVMSVHQNFTTGPRVYPSEFYDRPSCLSIRNLRQALRDSKDDCYQSKTRSKHINGWKKMKKR